MKSKAPLVMMEQIVMILVFALAAALCLQAFVLSDSMSREGQRRDKAVLLCQNLAEECKASGHAGENVIPVPDASGEISSAPVYYYDENSQLTESPSVYHVEAVRLSSDVPALARAQVTAYDEATGKELFSMEFAWQEEDG